MQFKIFWIGTIETVFILTPDVLLWSLLLAGDSYIYVLIKKKIRLKTFIKTKCIDFGTLARVT